MGYLVFGNVSLGLGAPNVPESIALAHRMKRMPGEEGIERESSKPEPLGSQTGGSRRAYN